MAVEIDGTEVQFDVGGEVLYVNESGLDDDAILEAMGNQYPEIARSVNNWVKSSMGAARQGSLFEQNVFVSPNNFFDELRTASYAVKYDDIVSNAADTTEQLAFKRVRVETIDENQNDVWAQLTDAVDLEQRMREIWREVFTYSQCYVAVIWHSKDYKVRIKKESRPSRKTYNGLIVPRGISILDPLKVIPVGTFMFGEERLAYIADRGQVGTFDEVLAGQNTSDLVVKNLIEKRYVPSKDEAETLANLTGIDDIDKRLYLIKKENAFRVTASRPAYQRTADIRLASVFELLDLKHILRENDRTDILSATNAIILVKKGSDERPASGAELQGAREQLMKTSRVPLIVSDHRIEIQIITRKTDKTMSIERYNGLDSRLTGRLYQTLTTGGYTTGTATDTSPNLFKIISASMEARRDNIRDAVMTNIIKITQKKNEKQLEEDPEMKFYPRRIALDFDNNVATFIQDLKDRNLISAETQLAEMDIEIDNEMGKIRREQEQYGDVLALNQVPYSSPIGVGAPGDLPAPNTPAPTVDPKQAPTPKAAGRAGGGNRNGGGINPESKNPNPPK